MPKLTDDQIAVLESQLIDQAPDGLTEEQFYEWMDRRMSEAIRTSERGDDRTWADTAIDALPYAGGIAGGIVGAGLGPLAIGTAAIGGAGGEAWKRAINSIRGKTSASDETPGAVVRAVTRSGAEQGVAQAVGMGTERAVRAVAPFVMRGAFGAQTALRRKFPTVNLERVALREGVNANNTAKAAKIAREANKALATAAKNAEHSGAMPIGPDEVVRGLDDLLQNARSGRFADDVAQIEEAARDIGGTYRGGMKMADAMVRKRRLQALAKPVMQGASDPRSASMAAKIRGAEAKALTDAIRQRSASVGQALDRSQEAMALERATRNMSGPSRLRVIADVGSGVAGLVAGGANDPSDALLAALAAGAMHAGTSPASISLLARLLNTGALSREPARAGMAAIMANHRENDK